MTAITRLSAMCHPHWNELASLRPVARIWRKDHTLWKPEPAEITNRLGWLDLPTSMRTTIPELSRLGTSCMDRGIKHVVMLGMGGSSLCAEVLRQVFRDRGEFPKLTVLDSTIPAAVKRVHDKIDPVKTLFIVASKSGTTTEVLSFFAYFWKVVAEARSAAAGENFVAITDPDSPLLLVANEHGFLRTFINPADVGGRYSALSYFGLVPAATIGLNLGDLLMRGREVARACGVTAPHYENPGAWLGICMGYMARNGRNKLTIMTSPSLASFGLWAEQLIAESTGKDGVGILPIAGEPLGPVSSYGDDRMFAYLRLAEDDNAEMDRHIEAVDKAGIPVMGMDLRDQSDIAGEFFRWEFAVAVAGACLGINPFDQPNVKESKTITGRLLAQYEQDGKLPLLENEGAFKELLASAKSGDYLAFMAFAAETPELAEAFDALRAKLLAEHRLATTLGYGPRFLHSTGQLHKGGANNGLFVQLYEEAEEELPIPCKAYGFGVLAAVQAQGDFEALKAHGRRVIRIRIPVGESTADYVRQLAQECDAN